MFNKSSPAAALYWCKERVRESLSRTFHARSELKVDKGDQSSCQTTATRRTTYIKAQVRQKEEEEGATKKGTKSI